ncbi:hypothetical protein [Luteimonas aquatica]|uniref:hypothetical protein n=1 Tax=Luteimonas aquatica TaxID=450364 RepID=UPI001F57F942|nr:hypothetical protein [Luteimonas aquatica]
MARKSATGKVVIKHLGKRSGNLSAPALRRIVREARSRVPVKKGGDLKVRDTATGSGHIGFDRDRDGRSARAHAA